MESSSGSAAARRACACADLSRVLAGPYCTMVLADLGADVIKVERPEGGDETRSWGPPFAGGEAAYYLSVNRGKRSCALDLSQPEGRALALELCAGADVVIENFKVGGADRLGVGYEQVRERNPTVVYCSITGLRLRARAVRTSRLRLRGPGGVGPDVDHGTARRARRTRWAWRWWTCSRAFTRPPRCSPRCTGERAARIEVPLLDSGLAGLVNVAQNALVTGTEPERHGNAHPNIVPYQDFRDLVRPDRGGRRERRTVPRALLRDGARASSARGRALRHERGSGRAPKRSSIPLLETRFRERSAEDWLADLDGRRRARRQGALGPGRAGSRGRGGPPGHGDGRAPDGRPARPGGARRSGAPPAPRRRPPPLLGEHTAEVLGELGRSAEEIEALAARGVIRLDAR